MNILQNSQKYAEYSKTESKKKKTKKESKKKHIQMLLIRSVTLTCNAEGYLLLIRHVHTCVA